jgi:hypothetical protein
LVLDRTSVLCCNEGDRRGPKSREEAQGGERGEAGGRKPEAGSWKLEAPRLRGQAGRRRRLTMESREAEAEAATPTSANGTGLRGGGAGAGGSGGTSPAAQPRGEGGRWQRGSSGNPRGRPPSERALSTILRKLLRAPAPGQEGMSAREALCLQLVTRALEGDMTAIRLVLEYTDGKPAQRVEGSMTVQVMPPFTSDEAAVAHAELSAWEKEDAETRGGGDAGTLGWGRWGEGPEDGFRKPEQARGDDSAVRGVEGEAADGAPGLDLE